MVNLSLDPHGSLLFTYEIGSPIDSIGPSVFQLRSIPELVRQHLRW